MILTRAPLRIPIGGGGTDLPSYYTRYGSFLITAAITKYVYVVANRPPTDDLIRLKYSQSETVANVDELRHRVFREALKMTGLNSRIEIATMADATAGTGLGSSGSFTVALLMALHALKGENSSPEALAEEAFEVERWRANRITGKQDHYAAAVGGLVCMAIETSGRVAMQPLCLDDHTREELRSSLLLFNTGTVRQDAHIQEVQEKETEGNNAPMVDSLHKIKELGLQIKSVLEDGKLDEFGKLLDRHWNSKKTRSEMISDPHIDLCYKIALENGALGGKLMGAGGGGFLMFYCPHEARKRVRSAMAVEGLREMLFDFDMQGARLVANV